MILQSPVKEKEMFQSPVRFSESITQHRSFESHRKAKITVFMHGTKGKGGRYNTNVTVAIYQLVFILL